MDEAIEVKKYSQMGRLNHKLVHHRAPTSNLEHKKLVQTLIEKDEHKVERLIEEQNELTFKLLVEHFENTNRIKKQEKDKLLIY